MVKIQADYTTFDPNANNYSSYNPPEGEYEIKIISSEQIRQGIVLEFLNKGDDATYTVLFGLFNDNPKARTIAEEMLGKIYYASTGRMPNPTGFDTDDMMGCVFFARLSHDHYNGKVYNRLSYIKPIGDKQEPAPATQVKTFNKPQW